MPSLSTLVEPYGILPDGRKAHIFTLTNRHGMRARVMDYGATLVSLEVPDGDGKKIDLTLGYNTFGDWLTDPHYHGATVGRFGNRIAHGSFTLDGKPHKLDLNDNPGSVPCSLHGGKNGFNQKLWQGNKHGHKVTFTYLSPDGEEGYPGALAMTVTYELTDDNELIWHATATTDRATPVNLINHTYWNLAGDPKQSILEHEMMIAADSFLQTNLGMIPDGTLTPVSGTPLDFTSPEVIGARIDEDHLALVQGNGYDHCWVLREGEGVRLAAAAKDPASGRTMEVWTDQPGIQFYTGNYLDSTVPGEKHKRFHGRTGFCLETQAFPDAPNQAAFPSSILRPGETYSHTMACRFSW